MQPRARIFVVGLVLAAAIATVTGKPGTCPSPQKRGMGLCTSTCKADDKCAGYLKCCPNSCGAFTCALPENIDFQNYPADKSGQCPPVSQRGSCSSTCTSDQQCSGSLKCCTNSCGASTCSFPIRI